MRNDEWKNARKNVLRSARLDLADLFDRIEQGLVALLKLLVFPFVFGYRYVVAKKKTKK